MGADFGLALDTVCCDNDGTLNYDEALWRAGVSVADFEGFAETEENALIGEESDDISSEILCGDYEEGISRKPEMDSCSGMKSLDVDFSEPTDIYKAMPTLFWQKKGKTKRHVYVDEKGCASQLPPGICEMEEDSDLSTDDYYETDDMQLSSAELSASVKGSPMKQSLATMQINVIGVYLFDECVTGLVPELSALTPMSLKVAMHQMSQNSDSVEDLDSEEKGEVTWNEMYVSATLQTNEKTTALKPKHKRKHWRKDRQKTAGVWVSAKQRTDRFDSFDSEVIFMDSLLSFKVSPPFKTPKSAMAVKCSHATLDKLHPQIAFRCFEELSSEAPGSVLFGVKQRMESGSKCLAVAMLYVRDLFEASTVEHGRDRSKIHLFQLELFEDVDNAAVKRTAKHMAKLAFRLATR